MGKETVRYPDALVARIEELVADSEVFESKSELHRFASDFFLCLLDPDHDPSVLGYEDILRDIEAESGVSLQPDDVATSDADTPFLESYLRVRRSLLHGDIEEARAYVTETYDITDREALLLDELIGQHRDEATPATSRPTSGTPDSSVVDTQPRTNGESAASARNGRDAEPADGAKDTETAVESDSDVSVSEGR
ncbi:hypothetical protein [Halorientalis salina]|uniref:hypothetical protein n=1 Tax=Halorientalis salina TaxID=2932266 RepID=UPI0010AC942A|nr:hypothetical protein [Halorientalis salina]